MNDSNEIRVTFAKTIQIMANIGVIMGSISDWETMKECCELLDHFEVKYNKQVVSAHRTPDVMFDYASKAVENGLKIIIAAAGGAAHLPGMVAAKTTLPVIAIGSAGAKNAALLAIQILATQDKVLQEKLIAYRKKMEQEAMSSNEKLHQS